MGILSAYRFVSGYLTRLRGCTTYAHPSSRHTNRLSSVRRTATPASTLPTVRETSIFARRDCSSLEVCYVLGRVSDINTSVVLT